MGGSRAGRSAGAATDPEIVAGLGPYRGSASALLMKAHTAAGDPARALTTYETRGRLVGDLGTLPSAPEAVLLDALAAGGG